MKPTASHLIPLLLAATLARADMTITQQIEQSNPTGPTTTLIVKIKGDKMRTDVSDQLSAIIDSKTGEVTNLMHAQKSFMTIPADAMKAMQAQTMAQLQKDGATPEPKPTGKTATISGFQCKEFYVEMNQSKISTWTTDQIPDAEALMKQLSQAGGQTDPTQGAMGGARVPGFPIRTEITTPLGVKTTMTVVGLNKDALSDAEFIAPPSYRKLEMPQMPKLSP
jgi:hypothetical protein